MSFQPGANVYTQGFGSSPENVQVPHIDVRDPSVNDVMYPIGKRWVNKVGNTAFVLTSFTTLAGITTANWLQLGGGGGSGDFTNLTANGTVNLNTTGAGVTTIGTGGTGATNIGNATGNTAVTGSLTASTTLTATAGAITATNGNLVLGTAGNKLQIATGANASMGTSAAMTAGAITINTTAVTASSIIFLTTNTIAGTAGTLSAPAASRVAGTSFGIVSSSNTDTSTVNWLIIN